MPVARRCIKPARANGSRKSARFRLPPFSDAAALPTMRKLFSPLGGDTTSPLNAPPLRMRLLTKLNLLAIGLIVATALGVAAFLIAQQIHDERTRLRTQGLALASMLAQVADEALSSADMSDIVSMLDGLAPDRDIAYVAVLDAHQHP